MNWGGALTNAVHPPTMRAVGTTDCSSERLPDAAIVWPSRALDAQLRVRLPIKVSTALEELSRNQLLTKLL